MPSTPLTPVLPTPDLAAPPTIVKATLKALPKGKPMEVHFNPASLVYTVENSNAQQGADPTRRQFAGQFTGKLTMDLQFDTTATGDDVRKFTSQVASFMQPSAKANKKGNGKGTNAPAPKVLSFDWGAYHFQGFMESFKETIDFFSADGVPLRSLVSIGLARQDNVFDPGGSGTQSVFPKPPDGSAPSGGGSGGNSGNGNGGAGSGNGGAGGSLVQTPKNGNVTTLAAQGGDAHATRALASANGIENPRFTGGAPMQVGTGIQLNAAVGFAASASASASASADAGFGASAGASFSASASAGAFAGGSAGASAGASFGASASAGAFAGASAGASAGAFAGASAGAFAGASASVFAGAGGNVPAGAGSQVSIAPGGGALFGSRASAGVPASAGAFAGIEVGRATLSTTANLDPLQMMPATVGSDVAVGANASFGLGGVALARAGFSTDVGAGFHLDSRLIFDSD